MKKLTKTLLVLSIAGFTLGILFAADVLKAGNAVGWYMTLPAGAICFGVFMISYMLEKEIALFDAEQRSHVANAPSSKTIAASEAEEHSHLSAKPAH